MPAGTEKESAFDAAAFKTEFKTELMTELKAELAKAINGVGKDFRKEIAKLGKGGSGENGDGKGEGEGKGEGKGEGEGDPKLPPEVNAALQRMERRVKASEDATKAVTAERDAERTQRLETERAAAIQSVLAGIPFRDQKAREAAYKMFNPDIKRDDDGKLIAETEKGALPMKDYIEANTPDWMLAPKGGGGSGAMNGSGSRGGPNWNMDTMSVTELQALKPEERAQIGAQLAERAKSEIAGIT